MLLPNLKIVICVGCPALVRYKPSNAKATVEVESQEKAMDTHGYTWTHLVPVAWLALLGPPPKKVGLLRERKYLKSLFPKRQLMNQR